MNQNMDIKKKSNQTPLSAKKGGSRTALFLLVGLLLSLIACNKTVETIENDSNMSLMDQDIISDYDTTESPFECKQTETVIDNKYLILNNCTTIQWGSPEYDNAHSLLYIENELFIASTTRGIVGERRYGFYDFVLEKYNLTEQKWNDDPLQWGTPYADLALTMNFDGEFLLFSGLTDGDLDGNLNQDATHDTADFFVSKATLDGELLWTTQFGGKNLDRIGDTIYDKKANEIIICGSIYENYPEYEEEDMTDMAVFIVDTDDGTVKKHFQFGSDRVDFAGRCLLTTDGNIVVIGSSSSVFSERDGAFGFSDAVIALVTKEGDVLWKRQFGTEKSDTFRAITIDKAGDIYAVGTVALELDDQISSGNNDYFMVKLTPNGEVDFIKQWGTKGFDSPTDIIWINDKILAVSGESRVVDGETAFASLYFLNLSGDILGEYFWGDNGLVNSYVKNSRAISMSLVNGTIFVLGDTTGGVDGNINAREDKCHSGDDGPCRDNFITIFKIEVK